MQLLGHFFLKVACPDSSATFWGSHISSGAGFQILLTLKKRINEKRKKVVANFISKSKKNEEEIGFVE